MIVLRNDCTEAVEGKLYLLPGMDGVMSTRMAITTSEIPWTHPERLISQSIFKNLQIYPPVRQNNNSSADFCFGYHFKYNENVVEDSGCYCKRMFIIRPERFH